MPMDEVNTKLGRDLLRFIGESDKIDAPDQVLNHLHDITATCDLNVLGALLFPVRWGR